LPRRGGKIDALFRRARQRVWLLVLLALVFGVYVFFMSAGGVPRWPVYGTFYDLMADGFRLGQLHLPLEPSKELLAAKNPYDPVNMRHWVLDASYYAGKYYAYWGPVPGVVQAIGKSLLGVHRTVGDHYLSLFALTLGFWAGARFIDRMARRLFIRVSRSLVVLCCLAFAFANPALHAASTGSVYYAAITSGQCWLLVGIVPAFDAVWTASPSRTARLKLVLAGSAWALALGSRVTLLPGIACLVAISAFASAWARERRWRGLLANLLWVGVPVAIGGLSLLAFNKIRFDDWFEFGTGIQLSAFPLFRFSSGYLLPNLYSYILRPFESSCVFPYAFQVWSMGGDAFPPGIQLEQDYMILEPVIGWLIAIPLTWLIPFAFLCAPRPFNLRSREARTYLFCLATAGALSTATGIVGVGLYGATMRYLYDVSSGLVLAATLGAFALRNHTFGRGLPRSTSIGIGLLAIGTVVMGMLIGYQGYGGQFSRNNPTLDQKLVETLSVCDGEKPRLPNYKPYGW
jgi:hypothetical protein